MKTTDDIPIWRWDASNTDDMTVEADTSTDVESSFSDTVLDSEGVPRPAPPSLAADIILIAHPESQSLGNRYRLPPHATLTIGRDATADISLPEVRSLSRRHASIHHLGDRVQLEDLGSTNGTFINDRVIDGVEMLSTGDRFQVGAVHFKFLHERDPEHAYHEAIHQLVVYDGLTQVYNKRKFEEEMARELARAVRHERPLTLILFDIDHFKKVNDTRGHLCGDFILQQITQRTRTFLRPEQLFARVGGEEFVIACPETRLEGALELAERLRKDIAGTVFHYGDEPVRISCSFGVAALEPGVERMEALFEAADRAMYLSKNRGRNQVSQHQAD